MNIQEILKLLHQNFASYPVNWLEAAEISLEKNELRLSFLHSFMLAWFREKVLPDLEVALREKCPEITLAPCELNKIVFSSCDAGTLAGQPKKLRGLHAQERDASQQERDYLADFIYNEKNILAVKAAQALAKKRIPENIPNIVLFCGPSGSGKSHLLKAILQKHKNNGTFACLFLPAKKLSLYAGEILASVDREPGSPALCLVDDLQELENSPSMLSLMTTLCDRALKKDESSKPAQKMNFRLALTLAAPGLSSSGIPQRLRSRLEQGLNFTLSLADLDIRLRFAERYNREKNLGLNRVQLVNIARQGSQLTDVMGLLHKIEFFVTLEGQAPTSNDLDKILAADSNGTPLDLHKILENVARRLNLKIEDILGSRRKPEYVLGRQLAMYLARYKLALSFQEIGKFFNGKDHSTVMYAVKKVEQLRKTEQDLHKLLTELEK